jgi:hypothetical protein
LAWRTFFLADAIFGKPFHPLKNAMPILSFHFPKSKGRQKDFSSVYYKNLKVNIIKEY